MSSDNQNHPNSSLEDILRELEERFVPKQEESAYPSHKKKTGINFTRFTQNQIISGLTLMLLLVGGAAATFLGQNSTELRQQAAYNTCVTGPTECVTNGPGTSCTISGSPGTCSLDTVNGNCTCIGNIVTASPGAPTATPIPICSCGTSSDSQCVGKSVGADCTIGGISSTCGASIDPDPTGRFYCSCGSPIPATCGGGGGSTPRPTNTSVPLPTFTSVPLPTNTPVPVTPGQPTNTSVPRPTNTSVPRPTNTSVPLPSFTATRTLTATLTPSNTLTPTPTPNSCPFLVAGENVTDGNQPPYTVSMYNYIKAAAPNTTAAYGTTFTVSGTQLKNSYAGIFYATGTTSTITNDATELDEYLNLGGNLLILADDTSRTVPAAQFLAKYGVSFASNTYGVQIYNVYPFTNTHPANLGLSQMFFVGPSYVRATTTPLVRSSTCQYSMVVSNNTTYCIWMRTELLSGGVIETISNYGAFGGGSQTLLGTGASAVPPLARKLAQNLTSSFCTNTTPTPTSTPSIGATCNTISMSYGESEPNQRPPKLGDNLTFTCGSIANAARYEFRIFLNGNFLRNINPSANGARVSEPFVVDQIGHFDAQCRACAGTTNDTCQQWEPL